LRESFPQRKKKKGESRDVPPSPVVSSTSQSLVSAPNTLFGASPSFRIDAVVFKNMDLLQVLHSLIQHQGYFHVDILESQKKSKVYKVLNFVVPLINGWRESPDSDLMQKTSV